MTGDVFEKDPLRAALRDDAGDLWPKVAWVVCPAALSSRAERLAGISGEDGVEGTAKWSGIKTPQIIPEWGWGEISGELACDEDASGIAFPLDEGLGVKAWFGQHDAQIQASAACAEGQSVPGT